MNEETGHRPPRVSWILERAQQVFRVTTEITGAVISFKELKNDMKIKRLRNAPKYVYKYNKRSRNFNAKICYRWMW